MGKLRRGIDKGGTSAAATIFAQILTGQETKYGHLEAIIDALPDSLFVFDAEKRLVWWNKKVEVLSGLTQAELKSKYILDFFFEKDHATILQAFERTLIHGENEIEVEVAADIGPIPFMFRAIVLKDPDGQIVGLAGVGRDITAKVHADASLQSSEERYRAVVQQASEGILLIDAQTRRILDANPAICKLLGYEATELINLKLYDVVAHDPAEIDRNISRILNENLTFLGRRQYRHKDGHSIDAEVNFALVTYGGKKVFCSMVRDITERLKSEEQLRKAREMETLGSLVSGVAHEVRSPLFVISTSAETLVKKLGHMPEVEAILDQVERLSRLMNDLLTLKPATPPEKYPHDFHDLIKLTVKHLEAAYAGCGERIQIIAAADAPKVFGDRDQLIQVFYNLLQNALQHSSKVEEHISVQAEYFNGGVLTFVRDRGPGIPAEHQQRVFEPFVTMRKGGVGLGLHIAKRIVENHSGTICVTNNNPGPGCCFEIFLPGEKQERAVENR
ncbi:MAG TPA: PAS domain S-box protein [Acidobacteriota bacterium]|nr:PAS domain S-box protein [Acidobacteriota bacterium]